MHDVLLFQLERDRERERGERERGSERDRETRETREIEGDHPSINSSSAPHYFPHLPLRHPCFPVLVLSVLCIAAVVILLSDRQCCMIVDHARMTNVRRLSSLRRRIYTFQTRPDRRRTPISLQSHTHFRGVAGKTRGATKDTYQLYLTKGTPSNSS